MEDIKYYQIINNVAKKYNATASMEDWIAEDKRQIEVFVDGISYAKFLVFYWEKEEEYIHYSLTYEYQDGIMTRCDMYNNVKKRLTIPFNEVSTNIDGTLLELKGSISKSIFTEAMIIKIIDSLKKEDSLTALLITLSVLYERPKLPLKKDCDNELLKVLSYFQKFGDGSLRSLHRHLGMTLDHIESNLETLLEIGYIRKDDDFEYVISNSKAARETNTNKLIKNINKEIKKHER